MTDPAAPKLETVELFEEEQIVLRGSSRTSWFVRRGSDWIRARELPGAHVERLDTLPGSVWRCRIELSLERATSLMLVKSSPIESQLSPLEHLERGPGAGRRVRRTYHRVGRDGCVEEDESGSL